MLRDDYRLFVRSISRVCACKITQKVMDRLRQNYLGGNSCWDEEDASYFSESHEYFEL